jgi:plasmid stabilization system protein ParE
MMRVEWSDPARDDLDELVRYISRDSAFYARRFGQKVVLATRRLREFPESGRIIPEAEDTTLREIIVQGYRVKYRLETDRVLVLAVMHGSRDVAGQDRKPWEDHRCAEVRSASIANDAPPIANGCLSRNPSFVGTSYVYWGSHRILTPLRSPWEPD